MYTHAYTTNKHTHLHAKTHTHACTHAHMHKHTHLRTHGRTPYTLTYAQCTHACKHACTHVRTHTCMHVHMHARTYIHPRMHSHTHTRLKLHDITHVHSNTRMNTHLYALYYYTHTFILKTRPVAVNCSLSCANSYIEMYRRTCFTYLGSYSLRLLALRRQEGGCRKWEGLGLRSPGRVNARASAAIPQPTEHFRDRRQGPHCR